MDDPKEVSNRGLTRSYFNLRTAGSPTETPNPRRTGIHTRGYLPHVKQEGATYFVTMRLADSMPEEVLLRFEAEKAEAIRSAEKSENKSMLISESNRKHQRSIERYLDSGAGACHLSKPEIAQLVVDAIEFFNKERYRVVEWVVMPNHVHAVVWPMPSFLLGDIVESWKKFTGREANKILGLRGRFWQPESWDHWIRDDGEMERICSYTQRNPVIAGLCKTPEEWRWGSAWGGGDSGNSAATG